MPGSWARSAAARISQRQSLAPETRRWRSSQQAPFNCPECAVEDLASIAEPGIFIVDDVASPPPITFLVLPGLLLASEELRGMIDDAGATGGHGRRNRA